MALSRDFAAAQGAVDIGFADLPVGSCGVVRAPAGHG